VSRLKIGVAVAVAETSRCMAWMPTARRGDAGVDIRNLFITPEIRARVMRWSQRTRNGMTASLQALYARCQDVERAWNDLAPAVASAQQG